MRPLRLAVLTVLALGLAPVLHAQEAPSPGGPPPASKAEPQPVDIGDVQTLKVNVNLVNVYFSVRDKNGYITNLHKDDCSIYEDKILQKTKNFTQEKNLPLTIGILLDTSGSQMNVLPLEQQSGAEFLKDVLTPKDEAFLISFDINVKLLSDYTNSPREIKRSIDSAVINTGAGTGSITGNGNTSRHSSLRRRLSSRPRQAPPGSWPQDPRPPHRRRRPGLSGEPQDRHRGRPEGQRHRVRHPHRRSRLLLGGGFGINLADTGAAAMERLAKDTGGRVINVGNNGKKLQEAFDQIQDELRTQYLASYTSTNPKVNDGTFRTLNITCGKDQKVQARKGYYAMADANTDN